MKNDDEHQDPEFAELEQGMKAAVTPASELSFGELTGAVEMLFDFCQLYPDDEELWKWLTTPWEQFGNRSALWLIRHGRGDEVLATMDRLVTGSYG
jgi:hypothetical protein